MNNTYIYSADNLIKQEYFNIPFKEGIAMKDIIITIGRQYGSGGRQVGKLLAQRMGVPFYDKELLTEAAKSSGFCEEIFHENDEKPAGSFLYSLVMGANGTDALPLNNKLFLAQFDTIKEIASKGSCVIIGRCADYALEERDNVLNVFIYADKKIRAERASKEYGLTAKNIEDAVNKIDKKRANYYNFYSGKKWGAAESYNICVDSGKFGIDKTVDIIKDCVDEMSK